MNKKNRQKGVSLVEVVIASSIMLIFVITIHFSFGLVFKTALSNTEHLQAAFLAEEGIEAVKAMRDDNWTSNIATKTINTPYRLVWTSSKWTLSSDFSMIDQRFDRTVVFSEVSRDASDNIVTGAGVEDSDSRKVTVRVAWSENNATTTKTIEAYISNVFSN